MCFYCKIMKLVGEELTERQKKQNYDLEDINFMLNALGQALLDFGLSVAIDKDRMRDDLCKMIQTQPPVTDLSDGPKNPVHLH